MSTEERYGPMLSSFEQAMRARLALPRNVAKSDWADSDSKQLLDNLESAMYGLWDLVNDRPQHAQRIVEQAADVANWAAMVADKFSLPVFYPPRTEATP